MVAKVAKRVEFLPVVRERDYADARFDIVFDGTIIGQVTRTAESVDIAPQRSMTGRFTTRNVWDVTGTMSNGRPFRNFGQPRTRVDAVADFLVTVTNLNNCQAREVITGKRAW